MLDPLPFKHIVAVDFEFEFGGHDTLEAAGRSGERPRPVCMVAKELRSGKTWRLWRGQFGSQPPFPIDADTVLVAYYASAELGCFKALNWPQPVFVLDLFTEFRARTNGRSLPNGAGLLGAATYFGIDGIDITEKQDLARPHPVRWAVVGRRSRRHPRILRKRRADARAAVAAMLPRIDLPRALLRGRFMKAAAAIEWNGTPIDAVTLDLVRRHWTGIQDELIAEIDRDYGVFEGRSFRRGAVATLADPARHSVADARERPARSVRRHLPANGAGLSRRGADA